jgi:hypothetical protein
MTRNKLENLLHLVVWFSWKYLNKFVHYGSAWLDRSVQLSKLMLARGLTLSILFHVGLQMNRKSLHINLTHTVVQTKFMYQLLRDYQIHVYRKILMCVLHYKTTQRQWYYWRNCWIQIILYGWTVRRGKLTLEGGEIVCNP